MMSSGKHHLVYRYYIIILYLRVEHFKIEFEVIFLFNRI